MFQGFDIRHLLHLHDEVDGIAAFATTEAFAHSTSWGDRERGSFIVVKWTQSFVACT
jgi:hypothetical protein